MSDKRFRLEWQSVSAIRWPEAYRGERPALLPEHCPDEMWHSTSREADDKSDILGQYQTLKRWAETGEELIRNVWLFEATAPAWIRVEAS